MRFDHSVAWYKGYFTSLSMSHEKYFKPISAPMQRHHKKIVSNCNIIIKYKLTYMIFFKVNQIKLSFLPPCIKKKEKKYLLPRPI